MGHRLPGRGSILDGERRRRRMVVRLQMPRNRLRQPPQIGDLVGAEIEEGRDDALGDDEGVTGHDGLQVDGGEGEGGVGKDLRLVDGPWAEGVPRRGEGGGGEEWGGRSTGGAHSPSCEPSKRG